MSSPIRKVWELGRACLQIGIRRPSDLRHVFGMAAFAASQIRDPDADIRSFPVVHWQEIYPTSFSFSFHSFPGIGASISLEESAGLVALMKRVGAKRIFEFGTYKGVSTTQMAANLPPGGQIYSLDLPESCGANVSLSISKESERQIANEAGKGSLIPKDLLRQVIFLREDSALFDPKPFEGTMDLVFVDGAHSSEYVRNDTEKGWLMLRPGGVIVWHDCTPTHRDVVQCLRNLSQKVTIVGGTTLAFAQKDPN